MTDLIDPDGSAPQLGCGIKPVLRSRRPRCPGRSGDLALLLMAVEPMGETELAQVIGVPETVVADALAELAAFYDETGRGFDLRQVGRWLALLHPRGARGVDQPARSSRASRGRSPRRRWRPWRWSPTPSRSRGVGCRRSAG